MLLVLLKQYWSTAMLCKMAPPACRNFLFLFVISTLVLGTAESAFVKEIAKLKQFNGIPGLTHTTISGAVQDGNKEVEAWVETVGSGAGTPIHRHDCEEIFIVLKGGGTVYIAPKSDDLQGKPEAFPFSSNSTFSIPPNAVHQVRNTNEEDLHFIVVISRPPMETYVYKNWNTKFGDAVPMIPMLWDIPEATTPPKTSATKDEL